MSDEVTIKNDGTLKLSLDGSNLVMKDGKKKLTTFGVKKGNKLHFQADKDLPFSISGFKFTNETQYVDAPFTIHGHGTLDPPDKPITTGTKYCSEKADDHQKLRVKINTQDGTAGDYTFGITIGDYHHDPEMDVESG